MRSTNIADLRDHLTQYLQEVRAGSGWWHPRLGFQSGRQISHV
ncbi:MAG: hypothetical protein ACRD3C_02400 [Vicinamibacterales bacterium]